MCVAYSSQEIMTNSAPCILHQSCRCGYWYELTHWSLEDMEIISNVHYPNTYYGLSCRKIAFRGMPLNTFDDIQHWIRQLTNDPMLTQMYGFISSLSNFTWLVQVNLHLICLIGQQIENSVSFDSNAWKQFLADPSDIPQAKSRRWLAHRFWRHAINFVTHATAWQRVMFER